MESREEIRLRNLARHEAIRGAKIDLKAFDQASRFASSMAKWAMKGFKIVPQEIENQRKEICDSCEFWDKTAFFGNGKCMKCGCSSMKMRLAHEKCPIGKWGPASLESNPS